jgi:hypothetical protein
MAYLPGWAKKIMSGDVRTKILNEIESSGFPLEIATFRDFNEAGWIVSPNLHYRTSIGDVREIDAFAAITSFPNPVVLGTVGAVSLVECKRSRAKPWVFFEEAYETAYTGSLVARLITLTEIELKEPRRFLTEPWKSPLSKHHYADKTIPRARTYFEAFRGREQGDIFTAVNSVWHAIEFARKWFASARNPDWLPRTCYLLPLIVFEGEMFLAKAGPGAEWQATPVEHILLRTIDCVTGETTSPFPDNEIVIDIVHKRTLSKFLGRVSVEIGSLASHITDLERAGAIKPPGSAD